MCTVCRGKVFTVVNKKSILWNFAQLQTLECSFKRLNEAYIKNFIKIPSVWLLDNVNYFFFIDILKWTTSLFFAGLSRCIKYLTGTENSEVDLQVQYTYCDQRPNSWAKSRQKSWKFSSLLFTVNSTALSWVFYFFKLTQPLTVSVKETGAKPDRKPYRPPSLWFKWAIQKPPIWELSRLCPETSMKLFLHNHEFTFSRCMSLLYKFLDDTFGFLIKGTVWRLTFFEILFY